MKRFLLVGLLFGLLCSGVGLALPSRTYAAYSPFKYACETSGQQTSACSTNGKDTLTGPGGIIRKVSFIVATIASIAAVIVMIIGALQFIVSNGDAAKVANARNAIIGAAIGLGIIVGAQAIIILVLSKVK